MNQAQVGPLRKWQPSAKFVGSFTPLFVIGLMLFSLGCANTIPVETPHFMPASELAPLPGLSIIFAANSTAEVNSLLTTDRAYIQSGDSFDLVSGTPSSLNLSVKMVNHWASLLRAAYPTAEIFASTSGIKHFTTLAERAGPIITGIFYDYEPGYEPEFTSNFSGTLAEFKNITEIAHSRGLLSVGYPTGQPILNPKFLTDKWNYGSLAGVVDQLVVQTQSYCHKSTSSFQNATTKVLDQYASLSESGPPTFQVTLGVNTNFTPNQVSPLQAYNCSKVVIEDGLKTLYVWWGPGSNSDVVRFLEDVGRTPTG